MGGQGRQSLVTSFAYLSCPPEITADGEIHDGRL